LKKLIRRALRVIIIDSLIRGLSFLLLPKKKEQLSPEKIRRILVFGTVGIGNMVSFTPFIRALRNHFPHSRIVLLFFSIKKGAEQVLEGSNLVDEIIVAHRDLDSTFIHQIGDWNLSYKHGKLAALYRDSFTEAGQGIVLRADDAGLLTGEFSTYSGNYLDVNKSALTFGDEDVYLIKHNPDGSWDQDTMFGTIHFDAEDIPRTYTITSGLGEGIDSLVITLNDPNQSFVVNY